jgi:hypothetical protein
VVTNAAGASTASVKNLIIDTPNLAADRATCDSVYGILFHRAPTVVPAGFVGCTSYTGCVRKAAFQPLLLTRRHQPFSHRTAEVGSGETKPSVQGGVIAYY